MFYGIYKNAVQMDKTIWRPSALVRSTSMSKRTWTKDSGCQQRAEKDFRYEVIQL